jgi:hypothetical protein
MCGLFQQTTKEIMVPPNYIQMLKLDKIALKSKTRVAYLNAAEQRLQYARNIGVETSFSFFVDRAWADFGDGE